MKLFVILSFAICVFGTEISDIPQKILEIPLSKEHKPFTKEKFSYVRKIIEMKYLFSGKSVFVSSGPPSIPLVTFKELQYWGPLSFGSEKKTFQMMFDTGSGWTWVPSKLCQGCEKYTQNSFACTESKTCNKTIYETTIHYGKGNVKGIIAYDDVWINENTKSKAQPFLLITEATEMPKLKFDGISGLGFKIMTAGLPTLLDNLFDQKAISKKSFSVYLESEKTPSYKSSLIFGGLVSKYMGEEKFHTCKVNNFLYWAIKLDYIKLVTSKAEIKIGGKGGFEGHEQIYGEESVIDTGTSLILLHDRDFSVFRKAFMKLVPGCFFDGQHKFIECFEMGQEFPLLKISLCGKEYDIYPISYLFNASILKLIMITGINPGMPISIMGDTFMKEFYVNFDESERTIGIMKKGKPQN